MEHEDKMNKMAEPIFDNLKKNTQNLGAFDRALSEKMADNREKILADFFTQAGCLPSEAACFMMRAKHGIRTYIAKR